MKLWGWWKDDKKPGPPEPSEPQMLDDLPPKFEDNAEQKMKEQQLARLSLSQTINKLGVDDFTNLPQVPCFRNAMLTGMGMGLTAGAVIFVSRRSVSRATNWLFGGFLVGSIVSWEQCRFRMLRGKRNVRQAQEVYKHKEKAEGTQDEGQRDTRNPGK